MRKRITLHLYWTIRDKPKETNILPIITFKQFFIKIPFKKPPVASDAYGNKQNRSINTKLLLKDIISCQHLSEVEV